MQLKLHKNATTTPRIRQEIQESKLSQRELARQYGISIDTVRRWKHRSDVNDGSHTPHKLNTTLTPEQEIVVVELRKLLRLPLDDLLVVTREFINPDVSRSGLARCLKRFGVSKLSDLISPEEAAIPPPKKTFKDYEPGYLHIDLKYLPQMADESARRYLFVAIDRASRWVYLELKNNKTAHSAQSFLKAVLKAAPFKIKTILTDNGKEFTDRFIATGEREPTGKHVFDRVCTGHNIDHRLIKPNHPQTNGMVERFNGRISEVLATTRFKGKEELEKTLKRYAWLYNSQIPQKALDHRTPIQMLKQWQSDRPELFYKQVVNHQGPDN